MPVVRKPPPLPDANIPVVDPATGLMTDAWRRYFVNLMAVLKEAIPLIP